MYGGQLHQLFQISIHAPRGGSDLALYRHKGYPDISIHAPRGGSDNDLQL